MKTAIACTRVLFVFVLVVGAGCNKSAIAPDPGTPQDLVVMAAPDLSLNPSDLALGVGRCFKQGYATCGNDYQCSPPLSTCQEGRCCATAGTLDSVTCECHCAGGPECQFPYVCCTGGAGWNLPDVGVAKCRVERFCWSKRGP